MVINGLPMAKWKSGKRGTAGELTDEQILELRRYRHKKYYQAEV